MKTAYINSGGFKKEQGAEVQNLPSILEVAKYLSTKKNVYKNIEARQKGFFLKQRVSSFGSSTFAGNCTNRWHQGETL